METKLEEERREERKKNDGDKTEKHARMEQVDAATDADDDGDDDKEDDRGEGCGGLGAIL